MDLSDNSNLISDEERRPVEQHHFSVSEAMGKMYKNTEQTVSQENIKSLGDFIRFTNEGIPTRAEQLKRDRKLYETNNPSSAADSSSGATLQGEVVGTIESHRSPKQRKGISVSFSNGQIVLDRSSINRQVDQFEGNDSDDEQEFSDLINKPYRQRKHKVVSWSVEETRQFYECLRRFGTDFFLMNKVITNRTRNDLKNKFKNEEKRNPRLVNLTLAVHLKEKVRVPDVLNIPNVPNVPNDSSMDGVSQVPNVPNLTDVSNVPNLADLSNVPNANTVSSVADVPIVSPVSVGTTLSNLPLSSLALNDPLNSNELHVPVNSSLTGDQLKKTAHAEDGLNADVNGEQNVFLGSIGHDVDLEGEKDEPVQIEGALSESSEEEDSEGSLGI